MVAIHVRMRRVDDLRREVADVLPTTRSTSTWGACRGACRAGRGGRSRTRRLRSCAQRLVLLPRTNLRVAGYCVDDPSGTTTMRTASPALACTAIGRPFRAPRRQGAPRRTRTRFIRAALPLRAHPRSSGSPRARAHLRRKPPPASCSISTTGPQARRRPRRWPGRSRRRPSPSPRNVKAPSGVRTGLGLHPVVQVRRSASQLMIPVGGIALGPGSLRVGSCGIRRGRAREELRQQLPVSARRARRRARRRASSQSPPALTSNADLADDRSGAGRRIDDLEEATILLCRPGR